MLPVWSAFSTSNPSIESFHLRCRSSIISFSALLSACSNHQILKYWNWAKASRMNAFASRLGVSKAQHPHEAHCGWNSRRKTINFVIWEAFFLRMSRETGFRWSFSGFLISFVRFACSFLFALTSLLLWRKNSGFALRMRKKDSIGDWHWLLSHVKHLDENKTSLYLLRDRRSHRIYQRNTNIRNHT